jgi:hypothetical protein
MGTRIEISTGTATEAYAVLTTAVTRTQACVDTAQSDEDKRFWSEALASYQAARDELAQQLFPLSHGRKAA